MSEDYEIIETTTTVTRKVAKKVAPTLITVVLDRSGSMKSMEEAAISNFNEFIESQKADGGECWITLTLFDTEFTNVYVSKPIDEVPVLTSDVYVPRGMTALYDAIGNSVTASERALKDVMEDREDFKSLCVIITDGFENSSREYTNDSIKRLVSSKEDDGWVFVFLGAGIDSQASAATLGMTKPGSHLTFTADERGYAGASAALRRATTEYKMSSDSSTDGFFKDESV